MRWREGLIFYLKIGVSWAGVSRNGLRQRVLSAGIGNLIFILGIFTDSPLIPYVGLGGVLVTSKKVCEEGQKRRGGGRLAKEKRGDWKGHDERWDLERP